MRFEGAGGIVCLFFSLVSSLRPLSLVRFHFLSPSFPFYMVCKCMRMDMFFFLFCISVFGLCLFIIVRGEACV